MEFCRVCGLSLCLGLDCPPFVGKSLKSLSRKMELPDQGVLLEVTLQPPCSKTQEFSTQTPLGVCINFPDSDSSWESILQAFQNNLVTGVGGSGGQTQASPG